MRAVIVIPVIDARTVISDSAGLLHRRPAWPLGVVAGAGSSYGEFLTGFGPLQTATPSESDGWAGRQQFVPATSVRLPADFPRSRTLSSSSVRPAVCRSRRLYGSRTEPRAFLELRLDFHPQGHWVVPGLEPDPSAAPEPFGHRRAPGSILDLPLHFHGDPEKPLGAFGKELASYIARNTVKPSHPEASSLISAGQAQLILCGPGGAGLDESWTSLDAYAPSLHGVFFKRAGNVDTWLLDTDKLSNYRRHLLLLSRLHVERTSMVRTLTMIPQVQKVAAASGGVIEWARLCSYLRHSAISLNKEEKYGYPTSPLLREIVTGELSLLGAEWQSVKEALEPHCASGARTTIYHIEYWGDIVRDKYENKGVVGAMGPQAHVHDVSFTQVWAEVGDGIDLDVLATQLSSLRSAARGRAQSQDDDAAVLALAQAQEAAEQGDGPRTLEHLRKAGRWALGIAQSIGVPVAVSAIVGAIGV